MVHGIHMDCSMWTGAWIGAWIPYGIVHGFAIEIHWKFHGIHMESIWTLHGLVHGMHHSMYSPYGIHTGYGLTKWLGTQPKNSPYGIHGLGGGIHPVHMESIWNYPGSVKTSVSSKFTSGKRKRICSFVIGYIPLVVLFRCQLLSILQVVPDTLRLFTHSQGTPTLLVHRRNTSNTLNSFLHRLDCFSYRISSSKYFPSLA
jgi:hypothetical protein